MVVRCSTWTTTLSTTAFEKPGCRHLKFVGSGDELRDFIDTLRTRGCSSLGIGAEIDERDGGAGHNAHPFHL